MTLKLTEDMKETLHFLLEWAYEAQQNRFDNWHEIGDVNDWTNTPDEEAAMYGKVAKLCEAIGISTASEGGSNDWNQLAKDVLEFKEEK